MEYTKDVMTIVSHLDGGPHIPNSSMLCIAGSHTRNYGSPAANSIFIMSRQHSVDVVLVPSSPRSSTDSAITTLGLADHDHQHLDPAGGLDVQPGQSYTPSEDRSENEMHTMDHTPSEIEVPTSNNAEGRTTTEECEGLTNPVKRDPPIGEAAGIEIIEIARPP